MFKPVRPKPAEKPTEAKAQREPRPPAPEVISAARPHPAILDGDELLALCTWTRSRAGGPGGQHRNKVETKVSILHLATNIEASAGERRTVTENQRVAIFRLRLALATLVRCPVPLGEVRSDLWKSRCSPSGKIACNPEHADFPSLLAEALDVAWATGLDVRKASARLCCTASQLMKFIKDHPPAWARLNQARAAAGEHPLK